jgi:predicted GTPase
VVGTTGTGKSSLLNAMIDEYNVLPTSGTQACTAVVVKIQNNYKNDLYYEADIEFLSTEVICIKQLKK